MSWIRSLFLLAFLFPVFCIASVKINEVAWMGNIESSYGEWLELYNDSNEEVDLAEAILFEKGGETKVVELTGKISPMGYYLIERVTPSVPDPVPGMGDDAGSFGGSGLSNSGEYLVLKDKTGTILDSMDYLSGWPAGDSVTKETMQRTASGSWMTATATPRSANATEGLADTGEDDEGDAVETPSQGSYSAHSSSVELSAEPPKESFKVSIGRNRVAFAGAPVDFSARAIPVSYQPNTSFVWSFGDGDSAFGMKADKTYRFPGEYVVILNASRGEEFAVAKTIAKIVPVELSLEERKSGIDGYVRIKNNSKYELNLGYWSLQLSDDRFIFPRDTIIMSKQSVAFPNSITGLVDATAIPVTLLYPNGKICLSESKNEQKNTQIEESEDLSLLQKRVEEVAVMISEIEKSLREIHMIY